MMSMANTGCNSKSWKKIHGCIVMMLVLPLFSGAQLINNGATIIINTPTNLVLNNLSFQNEGLFIHWAGTVSFTGSSPATISGTQPAFFRMEINKAGSSLQLQTAVVILDQLIFTDGLVNLNNNNIVLIPTALLTGEKETSRITGASGGYVEIIKNLNAPVADDPGNLGAVISSAANLGAVTIRRGHQFQVNPYGGGSSILRYYDIMPANNSALNATLRINYLDGELNGLNENNLNIWKRNGNGSWTDLSKNLNSAVTNFVEQAGVNNFTRFTLSTFGNTLPLVWSSFNTQCFGGQVRISWKTEQEQNTLQFIIRRSSDARNWTTIATLPAAGNSNAPQSYSYLDPQSSSSAGYYQIQQQDIDGRLTVSPVLLSNCNAVEELKVFPNPVLNQCWVSLQLSRGGNLILQLFDAKGTLVQTRQESARNGNNQFRLPMQNLAKGIYTLVIKQPDGNIKVVKLEKN